MLVSHGTGTRAKAIKQRLPQVGRTQVGHGGSSCCPCHRQMLGFDPPMACMGWRSDPCLIWACQGVNREQWQCAGVSVRVCKVAQASCPAYASTSFWPLVEDRP